MKKFARAFIFALGGVAAVAAIWLMAGCGSTPTSEGDSNTNILPPNADTTGFKLDTECVRAVLDSNGYIRNLPPYQTALDLITGVDDSTGRVTAVDFSSLSNIATLPPQIGNIPYLASLNVSYQPLLKSLPADIGRLSHLNKLTAGHCGIRSVSPSVFNCSLLTTISFISDSLFALPNAIDRLSHLSRLELEYNQFSTLPDSIVLLNMGMQTVNISHNCLTGLDTLKTVWVDKCTYDRNWRDLQDGCQ